MDRNLTLEVLNDLIEVNGLRIWNYQSALERSSREGHVELESVFRQIIDQGQRLQGDLEVQFVEIAHDLPPGGRAPGVILRVWNVVKSTFPGERPMTLADFFGKGERAIVKAYDYAVKLTEVASPCHELINAQRTELKTFYKQYKQLYKENHLVLS